MREPASVLLMLFVCTAFATGDSFPRLKNIKKIFVSDLGDQAGSDLIKEKIKIRLVKSGRFSVVESSEDADAILTGVAGVEISQRGYIASNGSCGVFGGSRTHRAGVGVLKLLTPSSNEIIWYFEYERGFKFGRATAYDHVADKTVKQLMKDAKTADKEKGEE